MTVFNYVVARPWPKPEDGLCIYNYRGDVQRGSLDDAKAFLKYVEFKCRDEPGKIWSIYKINYEKVDL